MGASAGIISAGSQATAGLGGLIGAAGQGRLITKQAELEQSAMNHQAEMLEMQAKDIIAASDEDVQMRQQQVAQMIGTQKASLAGQGVVVEGVTGQALESQEKKILREDQQAIKANAWRQAYGLEMRAQDFKNKSVYAGIEARHKAGMASAQAAMDFGSAMTSAAKTLATDSYKKRKFNKEEPKIDKRTSYGHMRLQPQNENQRYS